MEALDRLMKGRTSVVIAHRLGTIRHADVIFVIKDCELAEQGTHDALMAQNGVYAELHSIQTPADATIGMAPPAAVPHVTASRKGRRNMTMRRTALRVVRRADAGAGGLVGRRHRPEAGHQRREGAPPICRSGSGGIPAPWPPWT